MLTRRGAMLMGAAVCAAPLVRAQTIAPFRFALTPVTATTSTPISDSAPPRVQAKIKALALSPRVCRATE